MNKTILKFLTVVSVLVSVLSCSMKEENLPDEVEVNGESISSAFFEPGMVRLKLSEDFLSALSVKSDGEIDLSAPNVKSLDNVIYSLGITRMERTFPYAGKFEPRTREAGLHLWYDVYFDESAVLSKAGNEFSGIEGIEIVEYRPIMLNYAGTVVECSEESSMEKTGSGFFDDPELPNQWHYYNDTDAEYSKSGCDINVVPVWKDYTTGNPEVIVAVVDGGVDWSHEDLADNMWHNPYKSGDEIYGYNFVKNNFKITSDDHGTHVAGTIAAVNNNGKGVCGIAGGNKKAGVQGVKIMSCQIFEGENGRGSGAAAIKWGADNGAVISQNSWGYSYEKESQALAASVPRSDKDAIDYFTKYAGLDENGNQVGPMAGGLVIFAAGNDGWKIGLPGCYEPCLAVTSVGADYQAAYYTNYGTWTDIIATGGDAQKKQLVLSTLPGNRYGKMQGTSMACPHVSGVAALVISYAGGMGFTNSDLRLLLESTTKDISRYNSGKAMGSGLVDAFAAVSGASSIPPEKVTDLEAETHSNFINFSMTIPEDEDNVKPSSILVYYSETPFDSLAAVRGEIPSVKISLKEYNVGDKITGTIGDLKFNTGYHVGAIARDVVNNSALSDLVKVTTGENHAPTIEALDGTSLALDALKSASMDFRISDEDGHTLQASVTSLPGVSVVLIDSETARVIISGMAAESGTHSFTLKVEDPYGMYAEMALSYSMKEKRPPVKNMDIEDIVINSLGTTGVSVNLGTYFTDPDDGVLSYTYEMDNAKIIDFTYVYGSYELYPRDYGVTNVTITASDMRMQSVSSTFRVLVRDGNRYQYDVYPNPVTDIVNVRSGEEEDVSVQILSNSGTVVYSQDNVHVAPFAPYAIDMKEMQAGIYTVIIKGKETEYKTNISKI